MEARKEKKYLIGKEDTIYLKNYLGKILKKDEHNKAEGYIVRSLYFDTLNENDFSEKVDGVDKRKKIRIRVYDPNEQIAYLEIKQKQGDNQLKQILKITKTEVKELINGNYSVLLNHKEKLAEKFYIIMATNFYKPKAIVQYNRNAFITKQNNTRVTIDSNLIATEANFDVFSKNLNMYPVFENCNSILEVKYQNFLLSYIKDILQNVNKSELSVSKYCLSRKVMLNYVYI